LTRGTRPKSGHPSRTGYLPVTTTSASALETCSSSGWSGSSVSMYVRPWLVVQDVMNHADQLKSLPDRGAYINFSSDIFISYRAPRPTNAITKCPTSFTVSGILGWFPRSSRASMSALTIDAQARRRGNRDPQAARQGRGASRGRCRMSTVARNAALIAQRCRSPIRSRLSIR
jgi:hypothetical protein